MTEATSTSQQQRLDDLRWHRAQLREAMSELELALAAPSPAGQTRWAEDIRAALAQLSADFRDHVAITEGADGLYEELLSTAPRLSGAVARLTREHGQVGDQVDELRVSTSDAHLDVDEVRHLGTALLATLMRHRQRGSDLVYEAYEADVGGET